jgi:hypothetical protein
MEHNKLHRNARMIPAPKVSDRVTVVDENTTRLETINRDGHYAENGLSHYQFQREVNVSMDFTGMTRENLIESLTPYLGHDLKPEGEFPEQVKVLAWFNTSGGKRTPLTDEEKAERKEVNSLAKELLKGRQAGLTDDQIIAGILKRQAR